MRRLAGIILVAGTLATGTGEAAEPPSELRELVDSPRPAGCSEYRVLFWDLYRAELWSDAEKLPGDQFALSLTYQTKFTQSELVESSIDEMVRISGRPESAFREARAELDQAFRDVVRGDRITAWRAGPDRLRLFVNGQETGSLTRDVDLFLAIWLGDRTRHSEGRQALLAGRCDG